MKYIIMAIIFIGTTLVIYIPRVNGDVDVRIGIPFPGIVVVPPDYHYDPEPEYYGTPRYIYPHSEPRYRHYRDDCRWHRHKHGRMHCHQRSW